MNTNKQNLGDTSKQDVGSAIMFCLGAAYLLIVMTMMTPYTRSLDDIKVTLIHVLGPPLIIAYLALVGLGCVEVPRRGVLYPLGIYFLVMIVSGLLARPYCRWQSWLGIQMAWVLLGPFLAFFSCSGPRVWLKRVVGFLMLLGLLSTVFGLLIRGYEGTRVENGRIVPSRNGLGYWLRAPYDKEKDAVDWQREENQRQYEAITAKYFRTADETARRALAANADELRISVKVLKDKIQKIEENTIYRLANTFDGNEGKTNMMSFILNRQFYGAFLLLMIPMAVAFFLISGGWLQPLLAAPNLRGKWKAFLPALGQAFAVLTIVLGAACLKYTGCKVSRYVGAPVVFVLFILLLFFVARLPQRHRLRVFAVLAGLGVVAVPAAFVLAGGSILNTFRPERWQAIMSDVNVSVVARQVIWGGSIGIWLSSIQDFFIGSGPTTFGIMFPMFRRPDYFLFEISHRTLSSHNYFVDLLCDTGILGFSSFMAFLSFLFWKCLMLIRRDPDITKRILAVGVVTGLSGFLVNNFVSPNARWPIGAIQLWAGLGIMAGMINRPRKRDDTRQPFNPPTELQRKTALVLCALSVVGGIYTGVHGVRFFQASMLNNEALVIMRDGPGQTLTDVYGAVIQSAENAARDPQLSPEDRQRKADEAEGYRNGFEEQRQNAMDLFVKSIALDPNYTTNYYKLGTLQYAGPKMLPEREDYETALKTYRKLQQYCPEYAQIRLNLGFGYQRLGMLDQAVKEFRRAARMTIDADATSANMVFLQYLLQAARLRGSPALAAGDIEDVDALARKLRKGSDPTSRYVMESLPEPAKSALQAYRGKKASEEEKAELTQKLAAGLNPLLTAPTLYQEDRFAGVRLSQSTRERLEDKPREERQLARLNRALLADAFPDLIAMDPEEEAVRNCKRLVDWWDNLIRKNTYVSPSRIRAQRNEILENLANLYADQARNGGSYQEEIRAWHYLYQLAPQNRAALEGLLYAYTEHNDLQSLREFLEKKLGERPADLYLRSWLARTYILAGNPREAKRQVLILQKMDPQREEIPYLLYSIYNQAGNKELARKNAALYQGHTAQWLKEVQEFLRADKPEAGKEKG